MTFRPGLPSCDPEGGAFQGLQEPSEDWRKRADYDSEKLTWRKQFFTLCKKRSKKTLCFETQILERVSKTFFQTHRFKTRLK